MPEMHIKQPGLTYSACEPFAKNKERTQKFKETGDMKYIYQNELDKACFQHDMAYGDFKDLARRIASDKILRDKAFNIVKSPNYDGYQRGLASEVYNFFDQKTSGRTVKNENKYAWVSPLKDKKGIRVTNAFQKILKRFNHKPNKVWVDKGSEFYNRSLISFLHHQNIEMYSTHYERKSVVTERFIRTLKNKIYKYMTSILKNVHNDKLDEIINKYNNTYHRTIKMKPVNVRLSTYIDSIKEINDKGSKFKNGDIVRISKHKNIFAKGYVSNWSEEVFVITKIENTVPWTYVINDFKGEEIVEMICENELQKTNQKEFRV